MKAKDMKRMGNGKLPSFSWPGGYPFAFLDNQGVFCSKCATDEMSVEIHWEGPEFTCDGCNARIESAYGIPNGEE